MFSNLSGWRVNLSLLQEAASKEFLGLLDKCTGSKAIVWDDSISGPVGLVIKYTLLKERNVIKMLPLRKGSLPDMDVKNVIFITRPELQLMDWIAENVRSEEQKRQGHVGKVFHLYFLPKRSQLCENHLAIRAVYGNFTNNIDEFRCDIFPVDNDLLSMELKDTYRKLYIEGDPTCLYQSACALIRLQKLYGRIPKIYGKGNFAQKVWDLAKAMGKQETDMMNGDKGAIDQLIIIDRSIDLMSVLATQLTYEGLIDEIFGINQSTVHFPPDRFTNTDDSCQTVSSAEKKSIILNSSEDLYAEIRDKNFNAVGNILAKHAKSISSTLEERHAEKSVQDMKIFVQQLPTVLASKQSLATHATIAEMIKEVTDSHEFLDELDCEQEFLMCADIDRASTFVEDLIAKRAPLKKVLRLMCMQCIAGSGLKPKILEYYKRELVQVYGIEVLLVISNLERVGLLRVQTSSRTYAVLRKTLNLTVDDAVEVSPKDISYVHSFYAPLSIRIVEQSLKPLGWQSLNDVLTCLPGPTFEDYQMQTGTSGRRTSLTSEISQSDVPRVILVFFIGGCTFAEVSALRFLAQQEDTNVEFIVATTKLINKNTFLESFMENMDVEN